jgi:hypothetical protein
VKARVAAYILAGALQPDVRASRMTRRKMREGNALRIIVVPEKKIPV